MEVGPTVLGFPAESVTAAGTLLLGGATVALAAPTIFLAVAAWKQLPLLRDQLRVLTDEVQHSREASAAEADRQEASRRDSQRQYIETNTLRACEQYFSNPVIHSATQRLWEQSDGGRNYKDEKVSRHDLFTILNYLDGVAIGVHQGVFSEAIVRDYLPNTIIKVVDVIMRDALNGDRAGYEMLVRLRDGWRPKETTYRSGTG